MTLAAMISQLDSIQDAYDIKSFKQSVKACSEWLIDAFDEEPIEQLVTGRAKFVDALLQRLWSLHGLEQAKNVALCAVGGYGRGHLQPHSDVDLLIVSKRKLPSAVQEQVSRFITSLWDVGLDVGQSVRTVKETVKLAKGDITIATNLVESRFLAGCQDIFALLWKEVNGKNTWTSKEFFIAKYEEQQARHRRFNGTAYNLEPNVKENPGCLRDIQNIGWVAKKHFKEYDGKALVGHGYFTEDEHQELITCRMHLWRVRFALHVVAGRSENRLLFDYQTDVAEKMGYGRDGKSSVEKMMREFFRVVRQVSELNNMLLQRFSHDILNQSHGSCELLNNNFALYDGMISPRREDVFASPEDIFDFLLLITDTPKVKGLDTDCIRQLRNARRRFKKQYYILRDGCRKRIMQLFRNAEFFNFGWDVMYQYGILQSYLPQWDAIVGLMQFDLFHAYTVDEHTHRLVKNVNHYYSVDNTEFPRCGKIVKNLDKPELLYIAAIFHDIAKGRNGDHSTLGAEDVLRFCELHMPSRQDAELISWLVENHLLMSVVAQRRDIYDPEVINDFATKVRSHTHLNLLYALTLADIRATNDNLWNDWKSSLLRELYMMTQKALDNGLQCRLTLSERSEEHKTNALQLLKQDNVDEQAIERLWNRLDDDYFVRFKPAQIAWHSKEILRAEQQDLFSQEPAILVKSNTEIAKGGTEILLYGTDRPALFAQVASVLDSRNCSIHDAHITVTKDGFVFDSMLVLESDGSRVEQGSRTDSIEQAILAQIAKPSKSHENTRKLPRQMRKLEVPTKIRFYNRGDDATLIELEALDAPGILAKVGHAFVDQEVTLKLAKIATIGERAEDVFIVSSLMGKALTPDQQVALKKRILVKLDQLEDINIS